MYALIYNLQSESTNLRKSNFKYAAWYHALIWTIGEMAISHYMMTSLPASHHLLDHYTSRKENALKVMQQGLEDKGICVCHKGDNNLGQSAIPRGEIQIGIFPRGNHDWVIAISPRGDPLCLILMYVTCTLFLCHISNKCVAKSK